MAEPGTTNHVFQITGGFTNSNLADAIKEAKRVVRSLYDVDRTADLKPRVHHFSAALTGSEELVQLRFGINDQVGNIELPRAFDLPLSLSGLPWRLRGVVWVLPPEGRFSEVAPALTEFSERLRATRLEIQFLSRYPGGGFAQGKAIPPITPNRPCCFEALVVSTTA